MVPSLGSFLLFLGSLFIFQQVHAKETLTVEQVHSAWTGVVGERIFSFVTPLSEAKQTTTIQYGLSSKSLSLSANGTNFEFGTDGHNFTIHNVLISDLKANTKYYYRVGDSNSQSWSEVFGFKTQDQGIVFGVYGDFGKSNDRSIDRLVKETNDEVINAILHIGDFAYDLNSQHGKVGDEFMNIIQPVAATIPYMTCPGNHEAYGNFTHYKNRFSLITEGVGKNSKSEVNLWYSFNQDLVHFVAIDTEVYHYFKDQGQIARQLNWLESDLIAANQNRNQQPWIIMYGHKGWFMDNVVFSGFEELAHRYGVDLFLCGHVHNYQRFYPQHKGHVDDQDKYQYINPKYMTTIVAGSPGCREKISHGSGPAKALAFQSFTYGYGHLQVTNATHLSWEYQETGEENTGKIIDSFTLIQKNHGPRI